MVSTKWMRELSRMRNLRNPLILCLTLLLATSGLGEESHDSQGREVFLKTWRLVESNFFAPDLNGVDAEAVKQSYLDQIKEINDETNQREAGNPQVNHPDENEENIVAPPKY